MDADLTSQFAQRIREAASCSAPLRLVGGGTKQFYGREVPGEPFVLAAHRGILDYDPGELVLRARAGTPLSEIEAVLAEHRQYLPFEPPHFGPGATLGGTVAAGIAGPARAYTGAIKDFVLGVRLMTGKGEAMTFGGQVMKNVAGFDVSRLMAGSLGCLGLILDVSLKVLPCPAGSVTVVLELDSQPALDALAHLAQKPNCISGSAWLQGRLWVRLSGSAAAIEVTRRELGGETAGGEFWSSLKEHQHALLADGAELVRVVVPATIPASAFPQSGIWEWGGMQRWVCDAEHVDGVRDRAIAAGGFATWFRTQARESAVFTPPAGPRLKVMQRLKSVFDPEGLFNRGRLYAGL